VGWYRFNVNRVQQVVWQAPDSPRRSLALHGETYATPPRRHPILLLLSRTLLPLELRCRLSVRAISQEVVNHDQLVFL
jgi:hypothetical protein